MMKFLQKNQKENYKSSVDFNQNIPIGSTGKLLSSNYTFKNKNSISSGTAAHARRYLNINGYLVIEDLIDPQPLVELPPQKSGQYNYTKDGLQVSYESIEHQVPGSTSRYNYPKYRYYHSQVRLVLEKILNEKLYNTYYFDRFYSAGQRLIRHKDRPSCEISVSIQISTNSPNPWPLCIQTPNRDEIGAILKDGWGFLYLGCQREHWRDQLRSKYSPPRKLFNTLTFKKDDTYHHQIFFHYVRADGEYAHCAFDRSRE